MKRRKETEGRPSFHRVASTADAGGATKNSNDNGKGGQPSTEVIYHRLSGPASPLQVARASAAMLANSMIDLAHEMEDAGAPIGERFGTLILVSQAIYAELGRLSFPPENGEAA